MIVQGLTNGFRRDRWLAVHDFGSDTFKMAVFDENATLTPQTEFYATTNEVVAGGYTAGGQVVTVTGPTMVETLVPYVQQSILTLSEPSWVVTDLNAAVAYLYNASKSNKGIAVIDLGGVIRAFNGIFTVKMPVFDLNNALLRG